MSRRSSSSPLFAALLGALLPACGAEGSADPEPAVREVALPVVDAEVAPDEVRPLTGDDGAVSVVGAGVAADGALLVTDGASLFEVRTDGTRAIAFFTERPEVEVPARRIIALVPRAAGGAWVVADNGLYRTEGRYYVAVDPSVTGARAAFASSAAPLDGLWLATDAALVRLSDRAASSYDWPEPGRTVALAVAPDGRGALVATSTDVWLLAEAADGGLERSPVAWPPGSPRATAHVRAAWWVGGDALYTSDDPTRRWIRHAVPGPVATVGRGPDGVPWWTDGAALYALGDGEARRIHEADIEHAVHAPAGDVWILAEGEARRWRADDGRPTFAGDVAPWLEAEGCVACHMAPALDFRRYDDFRGVASDALRRVESGDMPRCGSDRCPPEQRLSPERYAVLARWIEAGMAP